MLHKKLKPRKHFVFAVVLLTYGLLTLILSGCVEKELINDPVTGSILPTENTTSLMDGQYSATTSYYDSRGYVQQLNILIKNGILTQVNFKEISQNKIDRITQEGADLTWEDLSIANLNALYLRLYNGLLLSQNPDETNSVSGATQTSDRFVKLSKAILEQAKKGDHETVKIDTFDTYTITTPIDPEGYQGVLQATFNGPTLINLSYDETIIEDGKSKHKSTDPTEGTDFNALFDTLTNDAVNSQSLDAPFPATETAPEKIKYAECLRLLKIARAPF
ncbi:FMN-binding protein [Acetobacterium woodii]|uniref:Uncharacterized protein n=1 Tax=Acetobacterium woodii (strain ATCC 29683 / DSM 1030 / JCM 2381 / KCTC 1655 / WB1) TaxID=931626 RepID=H6LH99_ACEWD|nr:hypothetical protein [Acetobacterium woodii]AFA48437.1 hypothetical protein Awo_c16550 [Acetobacterium woodii DSM 1030]